MTTFTCHLLSYNLPLCMRNTYWSMIRIVYASKATKITSVIQGLNFLEWLKTNFDVLIYFASTFITNVNIYVGFVGKNADTYGDWLLKLVKTSRLDWKKQLQIFFENVWLCLSERKFYLNFLIILKLFV